MKHIMVLSTKVYEAVKVLCGVVTDKTKFLVTLHFILHLYISYLLTNIGLELQIIIEPKS